MARSEGTKSPHAAPARAQVLKALRVSDVEVVAPNGPGRYVLVAKVDDDSLSDRRATFHPSKEAACIAATSVPSGWWPDCLIDLEAPIDVAVQDASVGDGSLGDRYPFDADHVIFA
jgi:hypothetical protein